MIVNTLIVVHVAALQESHKRAIDSLYIAMGKHLVEETEITNYTIQYTIIVYCSLNIPK